MPQYAFNYWEFITAFMVSDPLLPTQNLAYGWATYYKIINCWNVNYLLYYSPSGFTQRYGICPETLPAIITNDFKYSLNDHSWILYFIIRYSEKLTSSNFSKSAKIHQVCLWRQQFVGNLSRDFWSSLSGLMEFMILFLNKNKGSSKRIQSPQIWIGSIQNWENYDWNVWRMYGNEI